MVSNMQDLTIVHWQKYLLLTVCVLCWEMTKHKCKIIIFFIVVDLSVERLVQYDPHAGVAGAAALRDLLQSPASKQHLFKRKRERQNIGFFKTKNIFRFVCFSSNRCIVLVAAWRTCVCRSTKVKGSALARRPDCDCVWEASKRSDRRFHHHIVAQHPTGQ